MTSWPIIVRELRAESRRPSNFGLRMTGAAVATALLGLFFMFDQTASTRQLGSRLFYSLNAVQFLAMALLIPAVTSDCISRERREGTLGLLFLTPLTPLGVVLGKWVIQGLRGATLFASMLPILALPHLLGGVTSKDVILSILMNGSVMMLGLAAGILASALSKDWTNALISALAMGLMLTLSFMAIHLLSFEMLQFIYSRPARTFVVDAGTYPFWDWAWNRFRARPLSANLSSMMSLATGMGARLSNTGNLWGLETNWGQIWGNAPPAFQTAWLRLAGVLAGASAGMLLASLLTAAWWVRRSWRQASPNRLARWSYDAFCTPRFWRSLFRSKLRRTLDRNPVGWLEQFSVGARITKWGWCLFVVLVECVLVMNPTLEGLISGQYWIAGMILGALAFNATSSFRKEQESGAFELLLVTSLTERQIIFGRLKGVWAQFLPAVAVLVIVFIPLKTHLGAWLQRYGQPVRWAFLVQLAAGFLTIPLIGLRISMLPSLRPRFWMPFKSDGNSFRGGKPGRSLDALSPAGRNIFADWGLCCVLGLVVPLVLEGLVVTCFFPQYGNRRPESVSLALAFSTGLFQMILAALAWASLHRSLKHREFVLR